MSHCNEDSWAIPSECSVRRPLAYTTKPTAGVGTYSSPAADASRLPRLSINSRKALYTWGSTPSLPPTTTSQRRSTADVRDHKVEHPSRKHWLPAIGMLSNTFTAHKQGAVGRPAADIRCLARRNGVALSEFSLSVLANFVSWRPELLEPVELAVMAMVASPLRAGVTEIASYLLRSMHCPPLAGGAHDLGDLSFGERALHRAHRQRLIVRSTVVAAENYSAGIDRRGRLLIWGRPGWLEQYGGASATQQGNKLFPPLFLVASERSGSGDAKHKVGPITSVAASRHAVFGLTAEGQVLYAVTVREPGSMQVKAIEMRPLKELAGVKVKHISTRYGQAYAVSTDGAVYAWGIRSGDLSRPEHSCSMGFGEVSTQLHPRPIPGFGSGLGSTPINYVATGVSHAIFVSVFGEAYSVGRTHHGKLGISRSELQRQASAGQPDHLLTPVKVRFGARPAPTIIGAAAGGNHSLFLASNGQVWGCGMVKEGALPMSLGGDKSDRWEPKVLNKLDCFCTGIAAGFSCSFFVGERGEAYFTGTARQTTCPFQRPQMANPSIPWQIPGLKQVEQVSVSMELSYYQWEHAIFVRRDGCLYSWGHCGHGEFAPKALREGLAPSSTAVAARGHGHRSAEAGNRTTHSIGGFCNVVVPVDKWPDNTKPPGHA